MSEDGYQIEAREIEMRCRGCKKEYTVTRTLDIPENIDRLECNWCPDCEDQAQEDWTEYWIRKWRRKNAMRTRFGIQLKIGYNKRYR